MNAIARADLGDAIGHAGAAGDAVDETLSAVENAVEDALGRGHLPQDVHVQAAVAGGTLVCDLRLVDAAGDGVTHQLLVALAPRLAVIDLGNGAAVRVLRIGVDAGEGADAARTRPGARAFAVRNRDALAAFD